MPHGLVASIRGQTGLVLANHLFELGPGGGLGLAAAATHDPLAGRGVADRDSGQEALALLVPVDAAFPAGAAATVAHHQTAPLSCSSSATYSATAAAGIRRARPCWTVRSRPERISS